MVGLALEGGGARGAFHIGAIEALLEAGITFDGVVGTSIGAVNGAMIAQGDFPAARDWWDTVQTSALFDINDQDLDSLSKGRLDLDILGRLGNFLRDTVENKGLDTSRMRELLAERIDETRIRESAMDFGMVTVSAEDFQPFELFKEEIPEGKLIDYIMASASLPGFRTQPMDGKTYLDGGLYDNCPVNMLGRKGYKKVYAVRTLAVGRTRRLAYEGTEVISIYPSEDLGPMLLFSPDTVHRNMRLGYFDAKRELENLAGIRYYLKDIPSEEAFFALLQRLPQEALRALCEDLPGVVAEMPAKRLLFEEVIPRIAKQLSLPRNAGYGDIVLAALEYLAVYREVEKLRIYDLPSFVEEIRSAQAAPPGFLKSLAQALTVSGKLPSALSDRFLRKAGRMFLDLF